MASSSQARQIKHEVFISFRGTDTRCGFVSHLNEALCQKKIDVFVDDKLERGDEISTALIRAIETSQISLIVFSEGYASSKWCLDELVKIMECLERDGQVVIPIFYRTDPSDVRNQKGSYGVIFTKHEKVSKDKVDKWSTALKDAANLSGFHSSNFGTEAMLINQIVERVLKRLNRIHMRQNNQKILVGIHKEVAFVESFVVSESKAVRVLGIWGMGGIGKTTIAKELYDRLHSEYEGYCFVPNVRENLEKYGVTHLQSEVVRVLLEENDKSIGIFWGGQEYTMTRLSRKKVLLVLDDVNDLMKLENLIEVLRWLRQDSRVIVTSRDKQVLANLADVMYEVKALKFEESLQLFSLHAFKENYPKVGWKDLSVRAINYAKGIPLAIKVLGSFLYGRNDKEVWESQLKKLEKMPLQDIQEVLKLSYDELDRDEQDLFLCLACFFGNYKHFTYLLDDCGCPMEVGFTRLQDKALISVEDALISVEDAPCGKVNYRNWEMHDLIRKMGKEIVCGEFRDPGMRRHLWDPRDVYQVLENATGTGAIQSLSLLVGSESKELRLSPKAFSRMFNLKFLCLTLNPYCGRSFFCLNTCRGRSSPIKIIAPQGLESMPNGLRLLWWEACPLKSLPSSCCWENLIVLNLSYSNLERLWDGEQNLVKLKEISLEWCDQLIELPDFSTALNIERIDLSNCHRLSDLHPSILSLDNLKGLNLSGCKMLKRLRSDHQLKSLIWLSADRCTSLEEFSVTSKRMDDLDLMRTSIVEVNSLGLPLNKLLDYGISKRLRLPHNFLEDGNLWDLRRSTLDFFDPRYNLKCLTILALSGSNIEILPTSIKQLSMLEALRLDGCKRLRFIQALPPSLLELDVSSCISLEEVSISTVDCHWHSFAYIIFHGCCRLNQHALNNIMSYAHIKLKGAAYIQQLEPNSSGMPVEKEAVYVCLPGSKVPVEKYEYWSTTKSTMTIQLSNLSNLMGLSFCVIFSEYPCPYTDEPYTDESDESYTDEPFSIFNCSLLTSNGQEDKFTASMKDERFADLLLGTGDMLLWHKEKFSKSITDKIKERSTGNQCTTDDPKLSFAFIPAWDVKVKEWGVYPIYASGLSTFSHQWPVDAKTKKHKDTDELLDTETLPPTKKLKRRRDLSLKHLLNWAIGAGVGCFNLGNKDEQEPLHPSKKRKK